MFLTYRYRLLPSKCQHSALASICETIHIEAAGLYTREEAEKEASVEPQTMSAHPLKEFLSLIRQSYNLAVNLLKLLGNDPVAAAVRAENEACAKLTDRPDIDGQLSPYESAYNDCAKAIGNSIRARQEGK